MSDLVRKDPVRVRRTLSLKIILTSIMFACILRNWAQCENRKVCELLKGRPGNKARSIWFSFIKSVEF